MLEICCRLSISALSLRSLIATLTNGWLAYPFAGSSVITTSKGRQTEKPEPVVLVSGTLLLLAVPPHPATRLLGSAAKRQSRFAVLSSLRGLSF
jgi:hypothetical protein